MAKDIHRLKLPAAFLDLIEPVKRRNFVALRQRRIVEDRIYEVIQDAPEDHDRLTNMDQLCRFPANGMDTQHLARVRVKENLQHAVRIPNDLPARCVAIASHSDQIW